MLPVRLQSQSIDQCRQKPPFHLIFIPIDSLFDPIQSHQLFANPDLGMNSPKVLLWDQWLDLTSLQLTKAFGPLRIF